MDFSAGGAVGKKLLIHQEQDGNWYIGIISLYLFARNVVLSKCEGKKNLTCRGRAQARIQGMIGGSQVIWNTKNCKKSK